MTDQLDNFLPAFLCLGAALYLALGIYVSRLSAGSISNSICYFLFLIGFMTAGSGLAFGATEPSVYGIGRTLTFFSTSFLPVALYMIYRQFTGQPLGGYLLAALSIIPIITTILAVTNDMHHLVWSYIEVNGVISFTEPDKHFWFRNVHAPFSYGLSAFALMALAARLPTIALAHRKKVVVLLVCGVLPFGVSFANTILRIGPIDVPFTSATLVLMLPVFWWLAVSQRVQEFSPLAYQTLFDHVRDPIIVLDQSQRILSANNPAQVLLKSSEQKLIGQKLWQDIPEARAILSHANNRDMTQTLRMNTDEFYELSSAPLIGPSGQRQPWNRGRLPGRYRKETRAAGAGGQRDT